MYIESALDVNRPSWESMSVAFILKKSFWRELHRCEMRSILSFLSHAVIISNFTTKVVRKRRHSSCAKAMNNYHFQSNTDPPHGGESFEPSYFHGPPPQYYPPPPPLPLPLPLPHQQSYYQSSHSGPHPPPPHMDTTSSSDDSPYRGRHQAFSPPMFQNPYATNLPTTHSDTQSSSFESHGSSHGVPPFVGFAPSSHHPYHPAIMAPPPGYPHYYPWAAPPIEYITNIQPSDVLSGRGGATNSHCKSWNYCVWWVVIGFVRYSLLILHDPFLYSWQPSL